MSHNQKERIVQFGLILICCLFVALTRTGQPSSCQSCGAVPFWEHPPKDSWHKNEKVAVRIDDSWDDIQRGYFQEGINKWNQALNCSGVLFYDFSAIHFTDYGQAPPDLHSGGKDDRQSVFYISLRLRRAFNGCARPSFPYPPVFRT